MPAGAIHLLPADRGMRQGSGMRTYVVAVCGELLDSWELPPALCAPDCEDEHQYCPGCVREALRWNAELSEVEPVSVAGHER